MDPKIPHASQIKSTPQEMSTSTGPRDPKIKTEDEESLPLPFVLSTAEQPPQIKTEQTETPHIARLSLQETQILPVTTSEIAAFQFHDVQANQKPITMIAKFTVRIVRTKTELDAEFPGGEQAVTNLLFCLKRLIQSESFSTKDEKELEIRFILMTIIGENPKAKGPYAYPIALQIEAVTIFDALDAKLPVDELAYEVAATASASASAPAPQTPPRVHKRRKTNPKDQQAALQVSETTMKAVMRGISISEGGRRSYSLSDKSLVRNCNIVGNNGIAVGTWWPYRICALRDGAHGATMAGIAGSVQEGAYSIVVSGQYADLDSDNGGVIYYSGSKSHDNEDAQNPIITTSTRSLQTSKRLKRSIRVIRAAGGNPQYAPSVGFRYDGLYNIIDEECPKNRPGGRYMRFTLRRNREQPDIVVSRPNTEERAIFQRLKEF